MTTTSTRERSLTPPEVDERTQVLLALLDEQDEIRRRVRASRDELREWRVEARKLATQIDEVRQEIRTGIVTESAQPSLPHMDPPKPAPDSDVHFCSRCGEGFATPTLHVAHWETCIAHLGISGSSDEPDEATDPPAASPYAMFAVNYPKAETHAGLFEALQSALTYAEFEKLDAPTVRSWPRDSGVFEAVAHWARVENAHQVHATRPPTAGITLPARLGMPGALQQALATSQPKKPAKAGKKKRVRKVAA